MKNKQNYMLFLSLSIYLIFPFLYSLVRTHLINDLPSSSGLSIASQMEWFDLINETLLAFLIVPLYSILNKEKDNQNIFSQKIIGSLVITTIIYLIFSAIIMILTQTMVKNMSVAEELMKTTATYLKLETIAFVIGFLSSYANVVFVILGKTKYVVGLIIAKTITTIIGDIFLIPLFNVYGIAYSNILVSFAISAFCIAVLYKEKYISFSNISRKDIFNIGKQLIIKGLFSGGQSFLDNWIYAIMVCKMINVVSSQGLYWTANNFIWGFLLVPVAALSEIIKQESSDTFSFKDSITYLKTTGFIVLGWIVSIFAWPAILSKGMNVPDVNEIIKILLIMLPFYIVYAITSVFDSQFCGLGKLKYSFINSLIVNIIYYGVWYILFLTNIFTPSLMLICLMFGFGMVVHLIINMICVKIELAYNSRNYSSS